MDGSEWGGAARGRGIRQGAARGRARAPARTRPELGGALPRGADARGAGGFLPVKPLVSVVIPSYNMEAYTPLTVESALAQDYLNVEIIVVDDGSTDASVAALKRFDDRIRLIEQKNAGACAARNRGL